MTPLSWLTFTIKALFAVALLRYATACRQDSGVEFRGGHWYDGPGFEDRVYYAVEGRLQSEQPGTITQVIDLAGDYVIPPFGEAHNHRPDGWPGTEKHVEQFIEHGIFYVMNPNSVPNMTRGIEAELSRPQSIDVVFANGGLTPRSSHVVELFERNVKRGVFPDGWTVEQLDGRAFTVVENVRDLDAKWLALIESGPDFVKVFMGFSEEYAARRDDPAFFGKRGIAPALVPTIVERAHDAGLRVAAHIETAEDFRLAVAAGVDIVAHMPGSWRIGEEAGYDDDSIDRWLLSEEDAADAAQRGVAVVAHVFNGSLSPDIARIHAHNLELLKRHGVRLAIGSDSYERTSLREAIYLQSTGLFTPAEVLRIASEITPQIIFPERRIGVLADGYEASFLAIEGDPIREPLFATTGDDLESRIRQVVARIRLRVKQGHVFDRS